MRRAPEQRRQGRIRAALLTWLGVPARLTDSEFVDALVGASSRSGVTVTHESMLQLSAVWACARLISETIATLPLVLYERAGSGRRAAPQHPLYSVLHSQPNVTTTAAVHWEATVAAMLLWGNARAEKLMVGPRVVGLRFLYPARLAPKRPGVWAYTERNGAAREIPEERIFKIPGFTLDGENGLSVVRYGAQVFGSAIAAEQAAGTTFKNGLLPTTYFKIERTLSPAQREEFRTSLKRISGALNAGESPLLEAGMDVGNVGIDPTDAQLLETRAFGVEEICRWFRVPPFMVGHAEKSTSWGTGIEQQVIGFLTFTLRPWLTRIEQAIAKDLLTPAERERYYAEFVVEGLLRADSNGRSAYYSTMVNNGLMTRDEVRRRENLEEQGGNAARLTVQGAMTLLDSIGGPPAQG